MGVWVDVCVWVGGCIFTPNPISIFHPPRPCHALQTSYLLTLKNVWNLG